MRITFDHQTFNRQRFGGISRYFSEIASHLSLLGHDVSIVAPIHNNAYLEQPEIKKIVLGHCWSRSFYGANRIRKILSNCLAPVYWRTRTSDIVHETYYSSSPIGTGLRRVITVFDMINELFHAELDFADTITRQKRAAIQRADHIICISKNTQRDMIRLFDVDENKTSVVYLGHSLSSCEPSNILQQPGTRPFLLYVGERYEYKNFQGLLRAFASSGLLTNEFDIVSFGGPAFTHDELALLKRLGISQKVRHVVGDDQALAGYYQSAAAFVYPSMYEGFGIPPLEAMSYGCPVACSNTSSMPEVVGDAGAYFDPMNIENIRVTLEHTLFNAAECNALRQHGYERIQLFTWDKCAKETANTYSLLL